jgi:hypothetical protein
MSKGDVFFDIKISGVPVLEGLFSSSLIMLYPKLPKISDNFVLAKKGNGFVRMSIPSNHTKLHGSRRRFY